MCSFLRYQSKEITSGVPKLNESQWVNHLFIFMKGTLYIIQCLGPRSPISTVLTIYIVVAATVRTLKGQGRVYP